MMIGMPSDDHFSTIKLFSQHRPEQHMRPGLAAESKGHAGMIKHSPVMTVSPADGKDSVTATAIALAADHLSQVFGGDIAAVRVHGDQHGIGGQRGENALTLVAGPGDALWFFGDQFNKPALMGEFSEPVAGEAIFFPAATLADGNDMELHRSKCLISSHINGDAFVKVLISPHFLKLIEIADFRPEQMDDNIAGINQNPIAA